MADESVTAAFNLSVESNAAQVAKDGADGLANLQERMQGSVDELRNLNAAFRALKGGAGVSTAALDEVKNKLAAQKASLAAQHLAFMKAGGTGKEFGERAKARAAQEAAAAKAKAEREKAAAKMSKQQSGLNLAATAAMGAAAAVAMKLADGLQEVAKAAVQTVAAIAEFGVQAADNRRSELLQLEGLTKLRYGLYGLGAGYTRAADKASFLQSTIDDVAGSTALGRGQVVSYADQLYKLGLRSGNLQAALEGVTTVAATQGETAASSFVAMAAGAGAAGISVRKLADDVKARLGGIAAAQMLSLSVQSAKLKENLSRLFSGVNLDPLLRGMKQVTDLFKVNTVEGMALKSIVADLFEPLIGAAPTAGTVVRKVFQGILIGALTLENKFLDLQLAYYNIFGSPKSRSGTSAFQYAAAAGEIALYGLAGAAALAGAGVIAVGAGLAAMALPAIAAGDMLYRVDKVLSKWGTSSFKIGTQLAKGLANGLLGGMPEVIGAAVDLGGSVIKAFRDKLQIRSPSKVMFRAGLDTTIGQANGIAAGKPQLDKAVRKAMVAPVLAITGASGGGKPIPSFSAPRATAASAAPPPQLPAINLVVNGAYGTPREFERGVENALSSILGGWVIRAGGKAA